MKKTLFVENAFGQVYVWGSDKYGYTFQLVKPSDRNLVSDQEYLSAAKKFFSVQKFHSKEVLVETLERFMGLGVYGLFLKENHKDGTFSLKTKRYIPEDVRAKYRQQKEQANSNTVRLNQGISSIF